MRSKPRVVFPFLLLLLVAALGCGGTRKLQYASQAGAASPLPTSEPTASPSPSATAAPATPTAVPSPTPSGSPTSTATPAPTATPTDTPLPSPTATPFFKPAVPAVELTGITHVWQIWSNCGPATLVMNLSYYGVNISQTVAGLAIRPNQQDRHAGPDELAAYARTLGFGAIARVDGTPDRLRLFLSNGLPVIIGTWHENEEGMGMSHYRLVTGYDDAKQEWILYDSLEKRGVNWTSYNGVRTPYAELDWLWPVMNNTYLVVYQPAQAELVRAIIGEDLDDAVMWQHSLARARAAAEARPDDVYTQFTLGNNLAATLHFQEAAVAYDRARAIGMPYRMLWYQFGIMRTYYALGRYDDVLALTTETIAKTPEIEELHYWKGLALAATGDRYSARQELQLAVAKRPSFTEAAAALARLGPER